ncbi:MAG: hypothetical protein ABFD50_20065 [Smithella sp.]
MNTFLKYFLWFMLGDTVGLFTMLFWQGLCSVNEREPKKPLTHFDQVTQNPEKLAEVMSDVYLCKYCAYIKSCDLEAMQNCKNGIAEYLKQEVGKNED